MEDSGGILGCKVTQRHPAAPLVPCLGLLLGSPLPSITRIAQEEGGEESDPQP